MLKSSRIKIILGRWAELVVYGALTGIICHCAAPYFDFLGKPVATASESLGLKWVIAFWIMVATVVLQKLGNGRWAGFIGLQHFFCYPPLWWRSEVSVN